jgi:hypothetical protein
LHHSRFIRSNFYRISFFLYITKIYTFNEMKYEEITFIFLVAYFTECILYEKKNWFINLNIYKLLFTTPYNIWEPWESHSFWFHRTNNIFTLICTNTIIYSVTKLYVNKIFIVVHYTFFFVVIGPNSLNLETIIHTLKHFHILHIHLNLIYNYYYPTISLNKLQINISKNVSHFTL